MSNPRISVITVTLNDKNSIEKTIRSVFEQSYKNIEYIVIDGGSTDGSLEVIDKYREKLDYFVSEPDKGIYNAMNKGAKKAKGDYLFFLNSGDMFVSKNTIQKIADKLVKGGDLIYGKVNVIGKKNIKNFIKGKIISKLGLRFGMKISQQAMFVKRKTFESVGGLDERYKIASDFDLLCKILDNGFLVKRIDDVICNYDDSGISSDLKKSYKDTGRVIKERYGMVYFIIYFLIATMKFLVASIYFYNKKP